MAEKYYLHFMMQKADHAGSKAVTDAERILESAGYKPVTITHSDNKYLRYLSQKKQLRSEFAKIPDGAEFVVRHPVYTRQEYFPLLEGLKKRNVRLIFLINDLESLRNLPGFEKEKAEDEKMFALADTIIVHNERMKEIVTEKCRLPEESIVVLGLFDYLCENENTEFSIPEENNGISAEGKKGTEAAAELSAGEEKEHRHRIAVAGNLDPQKSGYVYRLTENQEDTAFYHFYGMAHGRTLDGENSRYFGSVSPEELPDRLIGDYGLVWDGPSIDTCEGNTGKYLKINDPHKFSLYVAAGLPIIIWKQAALAEFVERERIGVTVDSLRQIGAVLDRIGEEEYSEFCDNLKLLKEKIRSGGFLKEALRKAEMPAFGREI